MTLRGQIIGGAVVLDQPVSLPDGTTVEVRPVTAVSSFDSGTHGPTLYERLGKVIGSAPTLPADMAENHDHYIHGHVQGH